MDETLPTEPSLTEGQVRSHDFHLKVALEAYTIRTTDDKTLVLFEQLLASLKGTIVASSQLGIAADGMVDEAEGVSPESRYLDPESTTAKLFLILSCIDASHYMQDILKASINDSCLPLDLQSLERVFEVTGPDSQNLAERFFEHQWRFLPMKFGLNESFSCNARQVVPFCHREHISDSRTASVYRVAIPEEFLDEAMHERLSAHRFEDAEMCPGPCYALALKVFGNRDIEYGRQETAVVKQLRNSGVKASATDQSEPNMSDRDASSQAISDSAAEERIGLMHHLCAFEVRRRPSAGLVTTDKIERPLNYNILMECADSDLDSLMLSPAIAPPMTPTELDWFWTKMKGLVDSVCRLHRGYFEQSELDASLTLQYSGCHHDLKPSNVLLFDDRFSLADFGCASFFSASERDKPLRTRHRTVSYGPPGSISSRPMAAGVIQPFDLWSLGCILSEAATWVILGANGVRQFRKLRRRAHDKRLDDHEADKHAGGPTMVGGDMFHDGERVLLVVREWHQHLYGARRVLDNITASVLDIVDSALLVDVEQRIDAKELGRRLGFALERGRACAAAPLGVELQSLLDVEDDYDSEAEENGMEIM